VTEIHPESVSDAGVLTCGEATMRLLAAYGVDTVFGIPGVHTLDFCRGLADGPITHVQVRNEQGAGFMADGYARASGRPGVALVISGPGVTNALTAIGQAWADSTPVLLLSSETDSSTHGKGWGCLHEIPDQPAVTAPLTALSARANHPDEVPVLLAEAFGIFASQRPRPVHLSIPIDVLAMPVDPADPAWSPSPLPGRPQPDPAVIEQAAALLRTASRPVVMVGGGAVGATDAVRRLVDRLGAVFVASNAGKGIVPGSHERSLDAATVRPEVRAFLATTDVVVAIGTELAETDSFVDEMTLGGSLIRIDIDPSKMDDQHPADVGVVSDARPAVEALLAALGDGRLHADAAALATEVAAIREEVSRNLTASEQQHAKFLAALSAGLPAETAYYGDTCQLVYTGAFLLPLEEPGRWHYPTGYCTLGCGFPNAVGAKVARPDLPIVVLAGDGGVMFTIQELITAAELGLAIPLVIWDNGGLKQIQDDMRARSIPLVGVEGRNPDFVALAGSLGCHGVVATSLEHAVEAVNAGFAADRPTVIVVSEGEPWLA
jgi:thiamine pyrophosphate-dependent acetolactate synthase large subunit-like protein